MKMYGIKNCDTIKKAQKWLNEAAVEFEFHDYKKHGLDETLADRLLSNIDYNTLINKRGTTWRKLDEETKDTLSAETAKTLMLENPSIVKRPILENKGKFLVGFDTEQYQAFTQ